MLLQEEIAEERSIAHRGIRVQSPDGWVLVTHVCKTFPMQAWRLATTSYTLECAGKHLVAVAGGGFTQVECLAPGQLVVTESGLERVVSVEKCEGAREMYDLRVDSRDHTYFTDGILSHNSTGIGAAALYEFEQRDYHRSLYIAPLKDQVKTFADKLQEMQMGSVFNPERALAMGLRNNLYYKQSARGGSIRLQNLLTDPSRVRGQTVDKILVDEAQDFDAEHLPELAQVQKASENPALVFAGTSKDIDTCLENQFQMGSRGIWHIRGGRPNLWYSLNDPDTIEKLMTVDGLRCPETKKLLNPMNGEFVHEDYRRLLAGRPSFHTPQLIVPEYCSGEKWMEIWNDWLHYPRPKFLKEVMGIPVASGIREINESDLKALCTDTTFARIQAELRSGKRKYRYIVSGCDWGGSDYNPAAKTKQSYTVHVMLGINPNGVFDLLHAARYAGMDYTQIGGQIVHDHLRLGGFAIGTDNGVGQYYNAHLRDCGRIPTNRLLLFQYTDVKDFLRPIPNNTFNLFALNRTDSISALFADIKNKKQPRLRCPRWDESGTYLLDFMNSVRTVTETPSGRGILRYVRKGSRADDAMQAINFAVTVGRILLKESFIPNRQVLEELGGLMSGGGVFGDMGGYFSG